MSPGFTENHAGVTRGYAREHGFGLHDTALAFAVTGEREENHGPDRKRTGLVDRLLRRLDEPLPRSGGAYDPLRLEGRRDANPDSDLDILLILGDQATALKRPMRRIGYLLAVGTDVVPSIPAYTRGEWASRKLSGSPFQRTVERDEVRIV